MAENFDHFNAPQFFDFTKNASEQEYENVDDYFDLDHESSRDPLSEVHNDFSISEDDIVENKHFRRSMSVNDLHCLQDAFENSESVHKLRKKLMQNNEKELKTNMRKFGSFASLNEQDEDSYRIKAYLKKSISRESVNRLAQPKQHFSSDQDLNRKPYLTMAEAVKKFQNTTPKRFRTKPKQEQFVSGNLSNKLMRTIPQSPNLKTTSRARPVEALSREEQEKLEFEEAQKFRIKANPVNKKVLQGPMKPTIHVQKKPSTVPEPFKITAPVKKLPESPKTNSYEFHARPVPKAIHEQPKLKANLRNHVTNPQTPSFMKRYSKLNETAKPLLPQKETKPQAVKPRNTKPLPFSFEMRDLCMKTKRQELIQKVLEDEKKAREFHAQPVPKTVSASLKNRSLTRSGSHKNLHSSSSSSTTAMNVQSSSFNHNIVFQSSSKQSGWAPMTHQQSLGTEKSNENLPNQFKARPATVLLKKPFEPKKADKPLVEISEFKLNSDIRAIEREAFERQKREKEERLEQYKQMEETLRLQQEAEEVARLRKMAETKAQPVKKYKELIIQPSGKVTEPVSPKFCTDKVRSMRIHDKENTC